MDLIERYVHEVGRRLPASMRADVRAELRDLLEETLEDRAGAAGHAPDEETAVAVLREFGEPSVVAERYRAGQGMLIGPRFYPVFLDVCRVIVAGTVLVFLFGLAFSLPLVHVGLWELFRPARFISILSGALATGFTCFSWAVVVFAAVERLDCRYHWKPETWDPRTLPPVKDPDAASPAGKAVEIFATVLVAYWANQYLPGFGPDWNALLPLLNLLWAVQVLMHVIVLVQGRWRPVTRWVEFGTVLFQIFIVVHLLLGNPLAGVETPKPTEATAGHWFIARLLLLTFRVTLAFSLYDAGFKLYNLLRRRSEAAEAHPEWAEARSPQS